MFKLYLKEIRFSGKPWAKFLMRVLESQLSSRRIPYGVITGDRFVYLSDLAALNGLYLFSPKGEPYVLTLDLVGEICKDLKALYAELGLPGKGLDDINTPEDRACLARHHLSGWLAKLSLESIAFQVPYGFIAYKNTAPFAGLVIKFERIKLCTTSEVFPLLWDICSLATLSRSLPQTFILSEGNLEDLARLNGRRMYGHEIRTEYNKLILE